MATEAHTEHPAGKPQFPPFNKETFASQLVWFAIFFIALYVIISKLAIPRIGGIARGRCQRVEGNVAEANRLTDQSGAALTSCEESRADARGRAQALGHETRARLSAAADEARKKLESQLNAKLAEAEK